MSAVQSGDSETIGWRLKFNLTKLDCVMQVSWDAVSNYRTIYMIGDSVLRQQFMSLVCTLNSNLTIKVVSDTEKEHDPNVVTYMNNEKRHEYRAVIRHTDGRSTTIIHTPFGPLFEGQRLPLYKNEYPAALANGKAEDMIVINAGLHYNSKIADKLVTDVTKIVSMAQDRIVPVFFMETTDQQMGTSNGIYAECESCCCDFDACEVLTPDHLRGNASLEFAKCNYSAAFGRSMPNRTVLDPIFDLLHKLDHTKCVPDCLPANWKNDLVQSIVHNSSNNFHFVPTFRQLVARKMFNNQSPYDCTHKAVDTLLEMNRQLFRTTERVRLNKAKSQSAL